MPKVEDRLAQYRAERKKELNRSSISHNFSKPAKVKSLVWTNIWKRISEFRNRFLDLLITNKYVTKIGGFLSKIPVLGWPLALKTLLWFILFGLFVEIEFGVVYVIFSSMFLIYINTRTREKLKDEPSAYSVFNPNCERLQGSLTAEQFESELRYGAAGVK